MNLLNRKGTIRFIYDVVINFVWEASFVANGEDVKCTGTLEVYDVDNGNDYQYRATVDKEDSLNRHLKDIVKRNAPSALHARILELVEIMTVEYTSQGTVGDAPDQENVVNVDNSPTQIGKIFNSTVIVSEPSQMLTTTVKQNVSFTVSASELYQALTDPQRIMAFTGSPCSIENKVGTDFFLLDGVVSGKIVTLEPNTKIVQKWRFRDWEPDHYSHLIIKLTPNNGKTKLTLIQKRVPSADSARTLQGWEDIFWRRIRGMFGWSYTIL